MQGSDKTNNSLGSVSKLIALRFPKSDPKKLMRTERIVILAADLHPLVIPVAEFLPALLHQQGLGEDANSVLICFFS